MQARSRATIVNLSFLVYVRLLSVIFSWACRGVKAPRGQHKDKSGEPFLGFLKLHGLQHYLRLRKALQVTDQLSAELGVDLNVKRQTYLPHAALSYEVSPYSMDLPSERLE